MGRGVILIRPTTKRGSSLKFRQATAISLSQRKLIRLATGSDMSSQQYAHLPDDQLRAVHVTCEKLEQALRGEDPTTIEDQIAAASKDIRNALFRELLATELDFRMSRRSLPNIDEYLSRFLGHHDDIRQVFREADGSWGS